MSSRRRRPTPGWRSSPRSTTSAPHHAASVDLPLPAPAASPRAPRPRPTRPTRRYRHRRAAVEVEAQEAKLAPAVDKLKGMDKNAHRLQHPDGAHRRALGRRRGSGATRLRAGVKRRRCGQTPGEVRSAGGERN